MVLSNCKIDAASLEPTYRKPFDLIFQRVKKEEWLALEDDFRTLGISQIVTELPQFNEFLVP
jgi:hypothetical protein